MIHADIAKCVQIIDLSLYLSDYKTLVLADLHVGYEDALRKQGILIPKFHFKDLVDRLEKIFGILKDNKMPVEAVIINGDLKHEFGRISDEEWRNTLKLLDWLLRRCGKIILVQGNHDKVLGPIAEKREVSLVDSVLLGDIMITHGDRIVDIPDPVKTIIIAHDHPAVSVTDKLRTETFKCFLKGKYKDKTLLVMPSLNPVTEGTDMLKERPLSPFLRQGVGSFQAFLVGDEIYDFGKLKKLYK
jgi:putative SbcD/Mre11-related phosphoesterase